MTTSTSKGGWVNKTGYSAGKRHYYPDATLTVTHSTPPDQYGRTTVYATIASNSLCGTAEYKRTFNWTEYTRDGKVTNKGWGAPSIVENPNLMQRNLCSYCLKKFFSDIRPDLKEQYETLRRPVLQA